MQEAGSILFKEVQKFSRVLLGVMFFCMLAVVGVMIYLAHIEESKKNELMLSLIVLITLEIPIFIFFYYTRFEIIVTTEGLGYRWWPFHRKFRMLFKDNISDLRVRKSPALTYGYHWVPGYGWVNNMKGRTGIQVKLKSGKRIYIGTQQIESMKSALEKLLNKQIQEYKNEF